MTENQVNELIKLIHSNANDHNGSNESVREALGIMVDILVSALQDMPTID